jgi:hypothetical protein
VHQAGAASLPSLRSAIKAGAREVIIGDAFQILSYSFEDAIWLDGSTNLLAAAVLV